MTASIKEREDDYVTVKTTSKTKELSENKRTIEPAKEHWKRKRTKSRPERQVERDERRYRVDKGRTDGQEQRLAERAQELQETRGYRGDGF